jgi:Glycosyltransferase family 9 (heptosyltransferase)
MTTLALSFGALGDTILLEPCLRALSAGEVEVWGPTAERSWPLLAPRGPVARALAFPARSLPLWGAGELPAQLHESLARFERMIAFCGPSPFATRFTSLGGVCVAPPRLGETLGLSASAALVSRLVEACGVVAPDPPWPVVVAGEPDRALGRRLAGADAYVTCHPGAGSISRQWDLEQMATALRDLPLPTIAVVGPAELDRGLDARDLARRLGCRVVLPPSLQDLVGLLAGAAVHLGCDTGPTHLAAALGARVVAVFGSSDPTTWCPASPGAIAVGSSAAFPTAEEVRAALESALNSP